MSEQRDQWRQLYACRVELTRARELQAQAEDSASRAISRAAEMESERDAAFAKLGQVREEAAALSLENGRMRYRQLEKAESERRAFILPEASPLAEAVHAEMNDLRANLEAATAELNEAMNEVKALERLCDERRNRAKDAEMERDQALAQAAEMRRALEDVEEWDKIEGIPQAKGVRGKWHTKVDEGRRAALSSDAGRPMLKALQVARDALDTCGCLRARGLPCTDVHPCETCMARSVIDGALNGY